MTAWSTGLVVALVVAALALLLAGLLARSAIRAGRRREEHLAAAVAAAESRSAALEARLDRLEAGAVPEPCRDVEVHEGVVSDPASYAVRPGATDDAPPLTPDRIDGRLFADIVARESVVKGASLLHGMRVALTPENRNRIRFEVRREVKRARKQRRADLKVALREMQARERDRMAGRDGADGEDAA